MTKKKYAPSRKGLSPAGIAKFPKLNVPDTKFNDDGVYQTQLLLEPEEAAPLIEAIDAIYEENVQYWAEEKGKAVKAIKKADKPYKEETDHETGEPTGKIEFRFKRPAKVKSRKTGIVTEKSVLLVDRYGKPFKLEVTGGSTIVVNYEAYGWYVDAHGCGVTLKCLAVQVLEHREWGGDPTSAEDAGFDIEECEDAQDDGFEETAEVSSAGEF